MSPLRNESHGNVDRHGSSGLVSSVQGPSLLGLYPVLMSALVKVGIIFVRI